MICEPYQREGSWLENFWRTNPTSTNGLKACGILSCGFEMQGVGFFGCSDGRCNTWPPSELGFPPGACVPRWNFTLRLVHYYKFKPCRFGELEREHRFSQNSHSFIYSHPIHYPTQISNIPYHHTNISASQPNSLREPREKMHRTASGEPNFFSRTTKLCGCRLKCHDIEGIEYQYEVSQEQCKAHVWPFSVHVQEDTSPSLVSCVEGNISELIRTGLVRI